MKYDALRWPESQQRTTNRKSAMFKTSRALYSNGFRGLTVSDAITRICGEVFAIADGVEPLLGPPTANNLIDYTEFGDIGPAVFRAVLDVLKAEAQKLT